VVLLATGNQLSAISVPLLGPCRKTNDVPPWMCVMSCQVVFLVTGNQLTAIPPLLLHRTIITIIWFDRMY